LLISALGSSSPARQIAAQAISTSLPRSRLRGFCVIQLGVITSQRRLLCCSRVTGNSLLELREPGLARGDFQSITTQV
jgi:hypothetical protein